MGTSSKQLDRVRRLEEDVANLRFQLESERAKHKDVILLCGDALSVLARTIRQYSSNPVDDVRFSGTSGKTLLVDEQSLSDAMHVLSKAGCFQILNHPKSTVKTYGRLVESEQWGSL